MVCRKNPRTCGFAEESGKFILCTKNPKKIKLCEVANIRNIQKGHKRLVGDSPRR